MCSDITFLEECVDFATGSTVVQQSKASSPTGLYLSALSELPARTDHVVRDSSQHSSLRVSLLSHAMPSAQAEGTRPSAWRSSSGTGVRRRAQRLTESVEAAHASTRWWAVVIGRRMQVDPPFEWRRPGREGENVQTILRRAEVQVELTHGGRI